MVGYDAIVLFRHGPVVAPQAGLEMSYRHPRRGGCDRRTKRRVDIARNDDDVRSLLGEHSFDTDDHLGNLSAVAAGADSKGVIRMREVDLLEEDARHAAVV